MPDIISEFRQRYPQYQDIPDAQVYMKLADPKMFKQVFPEYQDLDEHTIGKNLAAEAGKVTDTGKPWYKEAFDVAGGIAGQMVDKLKPKSTTGTIQDFAKQQDEQEKAGRQEFQSNVENRKKAGYSLPYRATANTLEGLGLFNPAPMERAAAKGHTGEVVGQAVVPAAMAVAPLAIEGAMGAARGIRNAAMEEPAIARQKAMNVAPKSKQAMRAEAEGTRAAPYLKGAKNLKDIQSRIPAAKQEIFQPYMDAVAKHDATGQMLKAPDGSPVTATQLEQLRQETSAQLQSTRKMQPTEQWTAVQKGQQIADLTKKYREITSELDPAIKNQGIDPKRTRATFGAVKGVEKRFEGRSTLLENKPSGLGKAVDINIEKPLRAPEKVLEGGRDIVAGRGWFRQKPTDVQVREGFRTAGPKPDLTVQPQSPARGLPPGPIVTPPPQPGAPNLTPPPVAPTSRAQRLGLILPEQSVSSARPQIPTNYTEPAAPGAVNYGEAPPQTPPPVPTEPPTGQTPNRRIVRDPATGRMKIQYLTSSGGEILRDAPVTKIQTLENRLSKGIGKDEAINEDIPISKLALDKNKLNASAKDTPSKTNGPIKIYYNRQNGQFLVEDGMHRVSETIAKGKSSINADIHSSHSDVASVLKEDLYKSPAKPTASEPKIFTDSIGVKWAETPEGVRVSIPKGIRDENVMQYAKNKLAHQAEGQKSVKAAVPKPEREVYSRWANEKPKAMGEASSPPLDAKEHANLEKQVGFKLTDEQAKNIQRRNTENEMMKDVGKPEETFKRAEDTASKEAPVKRRKEGGFLKIEGNRSFPTLKKNDVRAGYINSDGTLKIGTALEEHKHLIGKPNLDYQEGPAYANYEKKTGGIQASIHPNQVFVKSFGTKISPEQISSLAKYIRETGNPVHYHFDTYNANGKPTEGTARTPGDLMRAIDKMKAPEEIKGVTDIKKKGK